VKNPQATRSAFGRVISALGKFSTFSLLIFIFIFNIYLPAAAELAS
jgi:hypothetical protein